MKKRVQCFCVSFLILTFARFAFAVRGDELNTSPVPAARVLVKKAVEFAEADKPISAVRAVKQALSISPNYLRAHVEYINIKSNFLNQSDEVQNEYQNLIRRNPTNAVYPMALYFRSNGTVGQPFLSKVVELAPNWAWGHYAKALLTKETDPLSAIMELKQCIDTDPTAKEAYDLLIELQEKRLQEIDEALRTAARLAAQTEIRPTLRLPQLWRLRLAKANYSEQSKTELRRELVQLSASTQEVNMLEAIRIGYLTLLNDASAARVVGEKIVRIDPTWTPERGWIFTQIHTNRSGVPRFVVLVNRQLPVNKQVKEITSAIELVTAEKIRRLQSLLSNHLSPEVRRIIYEKIFDLAVRSNNAEAALKYGSLLDRLAPDDAVLLAETARILADRQIYLSRAMQFAERATRQTARFHLAPRPVNTPQALLDQIFPVEQQRARYLTNRAAAQDALGWVLVQSGRPQQGEPYLREALKLEQSQERLSHLGHALEKLNRIDEAKAVNLRARLFWSESIKKNFINEQIADLKTQTIQGQLISSAELKGQVILVTFWASWCVPCRQELPQLKKVFEKFRHEGLQIVAISIDDEPDNARAYAAANKLPFFVSIDRNLGKTFTSQGIPQTLFIDKTGVLRYRKFGYEEGDEKEIELVLSQLLKEGLISP